VLAAIRCFAWAGKIFVLHSCHVLVGYNGEFNVGCGEMVSVRFSYFIFGALFLFGVAGCDAPVINA
ncbi:hypothetical protein PIB30_101080, partial [Stylosanthes scabra]|nr:hypothetical protein [Stylosanthes scabra]